MAEKMAGSGLVYDNLKLAYRREGKDGLLSLLTENDGNGKVRVSNRKSITNGITEHFENWHNYLAYERFVIFEGQC